MPSDGTGMHVERCIFCRRRRSEACLACPERKIGIDTLLDHINTKAIQKAIDEDPDFRRMKQAATKARFVIGVPVAAEFLIAGFLLTRVLDLVMLGDAFCIVALGIAAFILYREFKPCRTYRF